MEGKKFQKEINIQGNYDNKQYFQITKCLLLDKQKSPEIDKHIELFIRKFREHTYYSMLRRSYDKIHIKIAGNLYGTYAFFSLNLYGFYFFVLPKKLIMIF